MSPLLVVLGALGLLCVGYRWYSRFLADRLFALRADERMPADEHADGVDFVATKPGVLWGHHFASIAGAAPILGPAMAIVWGWVPALLWIVVGVVFLGATHDFGALALSIRHGGRTVGSLTERYVGPRSRVLFLLVIFFLIWLVGAVFAFAIAGLFAAYPASILPVNLGTFVAVGIGWWGYKLGKPLLIPCTIALVGVYALIWGSAEGWVWVPAEGSLLCDVDFWLVGLMVYAFVASCLPVWLLLQPRDLINSQQLVVGILALYAGFFALRPEFVAPAVGELDALPALFPLLFVTIACGAISGFHGLVSSSTTSKQLARATHARPIGYGGMLAEAVIAILATMAVATAAMAPAAAGHAHAPTPWDKVSASGGIPGVGEALAAFVQGAAGFLGALGVPASVGAAVVAVIVISFAATSLDTAMRIQREVLAELGATFRVRPLQDRWIGGALASGSVLALIYADKAAGAKSLWPVFGATNQVLAAITLAVCALYLRSLGRRGTAFAVPAVLVMAITFSAMAVQVWQDLAAGQWPVALVGAAIAALSGWVAVEAGLAWRRGPGGPAA
ncbi:MAG TPA: carbon starvation protein A [Planctomycetota bacterium]|nr:carbon starvation protein A [Planctomycetota bacterium]